MVLGHLYAEQPFLSPIFIEVRTFSVVNSSIQSHFDSVSSYQLCLDVKGRRSFEKEMNLGTLSKVGK